MTHVGRTATIRMVALVAVLLIGPLACSVSRPEGTDSSELAASEPSIKVYLLGTGGPELSPTRRGVSTLVEAGGQRLLFDVGRGAMRRMYESRVHPNSITRIFLTHLHNDHYEGLPTLWMTPWFLLGKKQPLHLWGPKGVAKMVAGMRMMFEHDLEHRSNDVLLKEDLNVDVTEISPGVIDEHKGLRVTAFEVEHRDGNPALGYRVDYRGKSVLLSGDTKYHQNVVQYGAGVDLLIHNVMAFSDELTKSGEWKFLEDKLATPEQAASVLKEAKPKVAIYSHIVKKDLHGIAGDKAIIDRTRAAGYHGELHMGLDRMTIDVGNEITIYQPSPIGDLPDLDTGDVELERP